jgi:hypothetical protein
LIGTLGAKEKYLLNGEQSEIFFNKKYKWFSETISVVGFIPDLHILRRLRIPDGRC